MKKLLLFAAIFSAIIFRAQPASYDLNTAIKHPVSASLVLIPLGAADDMWRVSRTLSANPATYGAARHISPPPSAGWSPPLNGSGSAHGWITYPFSCTPNLYEHNCPTPHQEDLYYRIDFQLPVNPVLVLDWVIYADDKVIDIFVNNTGPSVFSAGAGSWDASNGVSFKWCKGWVQGNNYIIVHTRSNASTPCYTGFSVFNYSNGGGLLSGNVNVCNNTRASFSMTPITGATSYQWTWPAGWTSGSSTGDTASRVTNNTSGVVNVIANYSGGCIGAATLAVNVITPAITIVPSATAICPGYPLTLTATGALTYSWLPPVPTVSAIQNPLTFSLSPTNTYTVTGWDANGCRGGGSITIGSLPLPNVVISAAPAVICAGQPNALTATGAVSYTWLPSPPPPIPGPPLTVNPLLVFPPTTNTFYTVIGTAVNGCTNVAMITLTLGALVPFSAPDTGVCSDVNPCTTLTASSPLTPSLVSYTWQPGGSTQPSISVCPTAILSYYTVTATSNVACANSKTVTVLSMTCCPPATEYFALPIVTDCSISYTNLAQFASITGTFSGPGVSVTGGLYSFNASNTLPPGTYSIAFTYTTAPHICSYTLYQTIVITPKFPIAVSAEDRCAYSQVSSVLGATLVGATANFYIWSPGFIASPTIAVNPTVTTVYNVIAYYPGCTSIETVVVNVNYTCCPQSSVAAVFNPTFLTAGLPNSFIDGPVTIDHDITISGAGDFSFRTGDFIMLPNVKVTLQQGVNLVLEDAHLYACSARWTGILVEDGANVTSSPGSLGLSSMIEDAITAIDVDGIGVNHATPLLNLDGVIFNKNLTGIKYHNSQLNNIPSLVKSCVFTFRDIPFSTLSWPSSSASSGLRWDNNAAPTSLTPPYFVSQNYLFSPGQVSSVVLSWGIVIENIGNTPASPPGPGIDLSTWASPNSTEFNLFDHMGTGILVTDASLTTVNNRFQYMFLAGIRHSVTSLMNARLSLTPQNPNSNTGNWFWTNDWNAGGYLVGSVVPHGIILENVFEFDIEQAHFRGNSVQGQAMATGIYSSTSKFRFKIRNNKFCALTAGIHLDFVPPVFNPNSSQPFFILADTLLISQNYFGPQINSSAQINGEVMGLCINVQGNYNNFPWNIQSQDNYIQSNIIDRSQTGIEIEGMKNYPLEVSNNQINIVDANPSYGPNTGVWMKDTEGGKRITANDVTVINGASYTHGVPCMFFVDNLDPEITCNRVKGGFSGFEFTGANVGIWMGNTMEDHVIGLYLSGYTIPGPVIVNGVVVHPGPTYRTTSIGQQGSPALMSANEWLGNWGNGTYETQVDFPSDPALSILYVSPGYPYSPFNNAGNTPYKYSTGSLVNTKGPVYNCSPPSFPPLPQLRISEHTGISPNSESNDLTGISFYPNPTSGQLMILNETGSEFLQIKITELSGKVVFEKTIAGSTENILDISDLSPSIYLMEIKGNKDQILRKKLIKN